MHFRIRSILFFCCYISILLPVYVTAQAVKEGDNLAWLYKKAGSYYFHKALVFTPWVEAADMLMIGSKPNPVDCDYLFLALRDSTLIGIYKNTEPASFLFDKDGKSILAKPTDYFVLPTWIVKRKTRIDSTDKKLLVLLNQLYNQTMQADNGSPTEETIKAYQRYITDTTLANRQVALLFDNYQNLITQATSDGKRPPPDICVPLMKALVSECMGVYNQIPPIVCIYMGEALQSAGMMDEAREHFRKSLQFYPNAIPLLVYTYQLEQNDSKKKEELADLKKRFPKHWMVKSL